VLKEENARWMNASYNQLSNNSSLRDVTHESEYFQYAEKERKMRFVHEFMILR